MRAMDVEERRRRIGVRHFLQPSARTDDISTIADGLVGLHASDPATIFLSAAVRMREPSIAAIEEALYERRSVIRHHGFRNTMWVMTPGGAAAMHRSTTATLAATQSKRIAKFVESSGISDDGLAWLDDAKRLIVDALRRRGTATTRELGTDVPEVTVPLMFPGGRVSAHSRIMTLLGFDGEIVRTRPRGSWISSQYVWTTMDDWLGSDLEEIQLQDAADEVLDRYLRAFGPATLIDVTWWTGWTKALATRTLERIGALEVDVGTGIAYVAESEDVVLAPEPWVALLPGLDPTTMGWKERDWYLRSDHVAELFDRNGNAGPTVWVDGRVVGGWVQRPDGQIAYRLLDASAESRSDEIDGEIERLRAIYGDTRHRVRFPVPIQADLLR